MTRRPRHHDQEACLPTRERTSPDHRTYERLDDLVEDVENGRVWGGLHYRTTMQETAKHFPRIAQDIGKRYFLSHPR
jgi:hypothetical protein